MIWIALYFALGAAWAAIWRRMAPRLDVSPGYPPAVFVIGLWWLHLVLVLIAATMAAMIWLWFLPARRRARADRSRP